VLVELGTEPPTKCPQCKLELEAITPIEKKILEFVKER